MIKNVLIAGIQGVWSLFGSDKDRFVKFIPAMPLFLRYENDLLRELAANMRLLDLTGEQALDNGNPFAFLENVIFKPSTEQVQDEDGNIIGEGASASGTWDGDTIPSDGKNPGETKISDDADPIKVSVTDRLKSAWDTLINGAGSMQAVIKQTTSTYRGSIRRLNLINMLPKSASKGDFLDQNRTYIPFLCQRAITVSESFQNSTQEHPIAAQLNSKAQEAESQKAGGGLGLITQVIGTQGSIGDQLKGLANTIVQKAAGEAVSNVAELGLLMTGSGRALLPEMWGSSSYSRDYSIDFTFFSPSGDTVSIFENCYIPFSILLVLSNPLQTAKYLYTSPFVVKVFSKGLFSVNMGMITSMTVTRGQEKNDRTIYGYPRTLKINLSIKDLSPTFMLSLGSGSLFSYRKANEGLTEYIQILTNLSIADRYNLKRQWDLYWQKLRSEFFDMTLNLDQIGFNLSQKFAAIKPLAYWSKGNITADGIKKTFGW